MKYFFKIILFLTAFLFLDCIALTERTGRFLDGTASAEKTLAIYRTSDENFIELLIVENKDAEKSILITLKNYPMIKFRGTFPNEEGIIFLTSLEYLAGNTHGWNEFTLQMLGIGKLHIDNNAILENIEDIECVEISKGRIHRYDTRITGDEALTALRNRRERITSLCEWMNEQAASRAANRAAPSLAAKAPTPDQIIEEFSKYWKPILFPETVSRKKRPAEWQSYGIDTQRSEDINWNTGYTENVFPQELWQIRNSGTLLRDWEEALYWIYYEYEWKNIINMFSNQINFEKIK